MPTDILDDIVLLILGAVICLAAGVIIIVKRKKMPYEVWIPLAALCVLGCIGLTSVAFCVSAAFVIAS